MSPPKQIDMFDPDRPDLPEIRCVMADPPWLERGGGKIKRGADRHYDLADVKTIAAAMVSAPEWKLADNAHCWIWVTDNFLKDGLWLIEKLGFEYKRTFPWVKVQAERPSALDPETGHGCEGLVQREDGTPAVKIGIGQYARGAHELLLFGVRGKGQSPDVWTGDRSVPSVLFAPHERGENGKVIHSRKPRASYDLIERVSKGPRLECFARIARPGWSVWGNEAPSGG